MKLQNTQNVIIVPWDFSELAKDALVRAYNMVEDPALIRVVHVTQSLSAYEYGVIWDTLTEETIYERLNESFDKEVKDDERLKDVSFTILYGDPGKQICQFADDMNAELIIMPSHGRTGFNRVMLGSVAERVVRFAPCPVLILRESDLRNDDSDVESNQAEMV